jgi:predicted amidohydrolase YtcJ
MTYEKRIPLLKDHHTHPALYTALGSCLDLRTVADKTRALALIRAQEDPVIVVFGWNNSRYAFEKEELESFGPVFICNVSLHCFVMNTAAKERFQDLYPDIVARIDDADWVERHLPEIFKFIVNIGPGGQVLVADFYGYLARRGIWYAEEMLLPNAATIDDHARLGTLERTRFWADLELFRTLDTWAQKQVAGIKLFTDGALGPGTAAVRKPYSAGGNGILNYREAELCAVLNTVGEIGKPAAVHAIGDAAADQLVNVLEDIDRSGGARPPGVRMEHCQFITADTARRARDLGLILSMQPNFSYDSAMYSDRLSGAYCARNNPFRMLIDEVGFTPGEDLIFGSDGMPHGVDYALKMALFPPVPGQRLTLEEFTAGYCLDTLENGHIDIQIDEAKQSVLSRVVIKEGGYHPV